MKSIKFTIAIIITLLSIMPAGETKAQGVSVSFSTFQHELSPYGRWINNPSYGQVWINNDLNFKPYYTNGHWEYTNYGWSWESDYDWGWAPFHYGRWENDPYYGWMWIPGYEWAAAWVSWSSYDDYYGWAPLGYGININVSFGSIPYNNWNFIPRRNICDRNLSRYYVSHHGNNRFRNAVVINNYYNGNGNIGRYVRGPQRREAERYTNNRIQERSIDYNDRNRNRNNRNNNSTVGDRNGRRDNDRAAQNNNRNGDNRIGRSGENENNNRNNRSPQNNADRRSRENSDPRIGDNNRNENNRRNREVNGSPQRNENTDQRRRQNENNGNNDQQNRRPQRQQEVIRPETQQPQRQPATQQRRMERRVDNDSRNVQQQRSSGSERGNMQRSNENSNRQYSKKGKKSKGE